MQILQIICELWQHFQNLKNMASNAIVFVWSRHDGGNVEQKTIGQGFLRNQRSQAKDCGRRLLSGSYQQDLDPTIHNITPVNVP